MTPNFKKNLQRLLQNSFWNSFMDVVQEEFMLLKNEMNKKRFLYRPDDIEEIDELRVINKSFGTFVDLTLLEDVTDEEMLEYMRQETKGLIFKVKYKGSYEYFKYVFNRVYEKGETYLCFIDGQGIIQKGIDYEEAVQEFLTHDATIPFIKVPHVFPTFDQKVARYTFDDPERATFDTGWRFDPALIGQTLNITKHMMVEFQPTSLVSKEGSSESYLLTAKYFRYLERAINNKIQRKTTTIPHIGVQITLYTDESENVFSINDLNSTCNVTPDYSREYGYVKAGDSINGYYYTRELSTNEAYTLHPEYNLINTWIPARKIKPETITQGDGGTTIFDSDNASYDVIQFPGIEKKSLRVHWTSGGTNYIGYDDGNGNITETENRMTGEIDYQTGEYRFVFYRSSDTTEFAPDNGTDIWIEYYTEQNLEIENVALMNNSGVEIVQSTFAPVEFYSKENHISVHFMIEKTT